MSEMRWKIYNPVFTLSFLYLIPNFFVENKCFFLISKYQRSPDYFYLCDVDSVAI